MTINVKLREDDWFKEHEHQPSEQAQEIYSRRQDLLAIMVGVEGTYQSGKELRTMLDSIPDVKGFSMPQSVSDPG